MAKLIYSAIASLDGYVEDEHGKFEWARPDEELHSFINDLERPVGTYLYGRRMYETMLFWEEANPDDSRSAAVRDYIAIWRSAEKVVFSRTLEEVSSERTRIERKFEHNHIRQLKAASDRDITVGGAALAASAFAAGLLDEIQLFLHPVLVGAGKRALPSGRKCELGLLDERRFESGVVFLSYRVSR